MSPNTTPSAPTTTASRTASRAPGPCPAGAGPCEVDTCRPLTTILPRLVRRPAHPAGPYRPRTPPGRRHAPSSRAPNQPGSPRAQGAQSTSDDEPYRLQDFPPLTRDARSTPTSGDWEGQAFVDGFDED